MPGEYFDGLSKACDSRFRPVDYSVVEELVNSPNSDKALKALCDKYRAVRAGKGKGPFELLLEEAFNSVGAVDDWPNVTVKTKDGKEALKKAVEYDGWYEMASMRALKSNIELALELRRLCLRGRLKVSDLENCKIVVTMLSGERLESAKRSQEMTALLRSRADDALNDWKYAPFLKMDLAHAMEASCSLVFDKESDYLQYLKANAKKLQSKAIAVTEADGACVIELRSRGPFENDSEGLHACVADILDELFSLHLVDVATRTKEGIAYQVCESTYSGMWYSLSQEFSDKVLVRCKVCGKTVLRPRPRSNEAKYCSEKCKNKFRRARNFEKLVSGGMPEKDAAKTANISAKTAARILGLRPSTNPVHQDVLDKPANASHEQEVKQWQKETEA